MEQVVLKKQFMLSFESIYANEKDFDPLTSLLNVSSIEAIEQIAYLLLRITNIHKDDKNMHSSSLVSWMMKMSGTDQFKILQFLTRNKNIVFSPDFILTDRRSCLRLMQLILSVGNTSKKELSKSDWGILFKSLLGCNALENRKQESIFNWDGNGGIEEFINKILPIKIRNLEIDRRKDYKVQLIKVYYFFEFCQSDEEYKTYLNKFLKFYGFNEYHQYIWNVFRPFILMMTNKEITCKIQIDETNINLINFFNQFSINDKKVSIEDEDYSLLRQFPLLRSTPLTYTVLYMNFYIDKLYQGFLWDFVSVQKEHGHTSFNYGRLKNDMGNKFSEIVLFYIVMQKCFQFYGDCIKAGEEIKKLFEDSEPDYYVRKADKIFLFEFKDATLSTKIRYSGDASVIKNELIEKFELSIKDRDKPQRKTINQLYNSISEIISGKYQQKSVDDFYPESITIYPIFIFTDVVMEADGVNYFLKERLNSLIEINNLPKNRINDLILINLDTLILYQDLFRNNLIDFADCINSYLTYIAQGNPENRVFSFDEYFKIYIVRKGHSVTTIPEDFNNIIKSLM